VAKFVGTIMLLRVAIWNDLWSPRHAKITDQENSKKQNWWNQYRGLHII